MDRSQIEAAINWAEAGYNVSLAVVLQTYGSAPRKEGALLAVRDDGHFTGSVSGGCMEGDIIASAVAQLEAGVTSAVQYETVAGDSDAIWQATLACGNRIKIGIFSLGPNHLTVLKTLLNRSELSATYLTIDIATDTFAIADSATGSEQCFWTDKIFSIPFLPAKELIVIGAVHIAQSIIPMAKVAEYKIKIIDPRPAFANSERFPCSSEAALISLWPDEYFKANPINAHQAILALSHDPKLDDVALIEALKSDAFYIGALGSKTTQQKRRARMKDAGFSDSDIARIYGPIGLDIGAATPPEIALSILSEITQIRRSK